MRILISIIMILGACFVLVVGLLSVIHDLLVRTTSRHAPAEFDRRAIGYEASSTCSKVLEDVQ
jgi:hypothetical protein